VAKGPEPKTGPADGPFSEQELENIRAAVRNKYRIVSQSAEGLFRYPTGREGAIRLGYDEALMAGIPAELMNGFCGVGNPFALERIAPGSHVLDVGCGAGFDLIVARRIVGDEGRVCGIDLSSEMLSRARRNFAELGIADIETRQVESERFPYEDNSFDVVISNGVINLSPAKGELFGEIRRVLRPGGRLQFADIVLEKEPQTTLAINAESWAQ